MTAAGSYDKAGRRFFNSAISGFDFPRKTFPSRNPGISMNENGNASANVNANVNVNVSDDDAKR